MIILHRRMKLLSTVNTPHQCHVILSTSTVPLDAVDRLTQCCREILADSIRGSQKPSRMNSRTVTACIHGMVYDEEELIIDFAEGTVTPPDHSTSRLFRFNHVLILTLFLKIAHSVPSLIDRRRRLPETSLAHGYRFYVLRMREYCLLSFSLHGLATR